jgi:N-acetylneuraminic acid mutarotase
MATVLGLLAAGSAAAADSGWSTVASMPVTRAWLAAASGADGRVYAIGGYNGGTGSGGTVLNSVDAFTPATGSWASVPPMLTAREALAATTGPDGLVYALGGDHGPSPVDTVEAYDPRTKAWATLPPMLIPRTSLAAVTGSDGRIYALGGYATTDGKGVGPGTSTSSAASASATSGTAASTLTAVSTVEAYDPLSKAWSAAAPMSHARAWLAAVAGSDGRIYAMGGNDNSSYLSSVEAYDPRKNAWTAAAPMRMGRTGLAAAVLPGGTIYALGGEVPPKA